MDEAKEVTSSTRLCGRSTPSNFISYSNKMQIVFRSDSNITADGFNLVISPKCGGVYNVTSKSKTFSFKNYIGYAFSASNCNVTLVSDSEHSIVAQFLPQIRGYMNSDSCETQQNLNIYKWDKYTKSMLPDDKFCVGSLDKHVSAESKILLEFKMKQTNNYNFKFEYYLESCRDLIRSPRWIYSPKSKSNYAEDCEWKIEAPEDHQIKLSFENFKLDYDLCKYSLYGGVQVHSGNKTDYSYAICGQFNETKVIKIPANKGSIKYYNPTGYGTNRFKVQVEFIKMCDQNINLTTSRSSESFTFFTLVPDNYECNYFMNAPDGFRIEVEFKKLSMFTGEQNCKDTFIELYEGYDVHEGLIQRICRNESVKLISPENKLNILAKGKSLDFAINVKLMETWCDSKSTVILTERKAETYNIQISSYPNNVYCKWTIKSDSDFDIILDYLDIQPRSDVTGDCLDEVSINLLTVSFFFIVFIVCFNYQVFQIKQIGNFKNDQNSLNQINKIVRKVMYISIFFK